MERGDGEIRAAERPAGPLDVADGGPQLGERREAPVGARALPGDPARPAVVAVPQPPPDLAGEAAADPRVDVEPDAAREGRCQLRQARTVAGDRTRDATALGVDDRLEELRVHARAAAARSASRRQPATRRVVESTPARLATK